jgi:hypothetical protein
VSKNRKQVTTKKGTKKHFKQEAWHNQTGTHTYEVPRQ